jgi:cell division protein ZapE
MLEVHERLRVERLRERGDPIPPVAQKLAAEARLLAFDEMVINNSADAMILSRLFGPAPEGGSDGGHHVQPAAPGPLQGRPQPELFLPFIDLIEAELDVVPLNGPTDYRLERLGGMPTWYVPNGPEATRALSEASSG